MKKEFLFGLAFLILLAASPISRIRYDEADNLLFIGLRNNLNNDMEDVRVRVFFPSLGIFLSSGQLDIEKKESAKKLVYIDTNEVPKGEYLVRIIVSNDDFTDARYRYITVT